MLDGLALPHHITTIPDNSYNNIILIKVKNRKPVKIIETTFEALAPPVK
jgi:hypothetical protein